MPSRSNATRITGMVELEHARGVRIHTIRRSRIACYPERMKLTIELDREIDGRWIAEIADLNVLLSGESKEDSIRKAESAAAELIADRINRGELPPESANPVFAIAA